MFPKRKIKMIIPPGGIPRTPREDALHPLIQKLTRWSPGMFRLCEDGKWRNANGEEGVCITLGELLNKDKDE